MIIGIEFLIAIGWITLVIGFLRRDYTLTTLPALYLMVIGTFILIDDSIGLTQLVKLGLGLLHLGTGFYISVRSGLETYKGSKFRKPKFISKKKKKTMEEKKMNEEKNEEQQKKEREEETQEEDNNGEED